MPRYGLKPSAAVWPSSSISKTSDGEKGRLPLSKVSGPPPAPSQRAPAAFETQLVRHGQRTFRSSRPRQRQFRFIERAEKLERAFKIAFSVGTVVIIVGLVTALPVGRYWTIWLLTRTRWLTQSAVGLTTDHREIEADWRRRRLFDVASARKSLAATFAEYPPAAQRLLRFAELDPDHALVRWGTTTGPFSCPETSSRPTKTAVLTVFAPKSARSGCGTSR